MKKFTADDISTRIIKDLQTKEGWSQILPDSAVISEIGAHSESNAELARYFEYILRESKWGESKNISSLLAQTAYLGYKPSRKVSAIGEIVFSHDPQLQYAGITNIFSLEDLPTYLTHYTGSPVIIPQGTIITDGSVQFITTRQTSYPYIDPVTGLTNDQYVSIPVIQGIQKAVSFQMLGNSFESIRLVSSFVENAGTAISTNFFSVYAVPSGSSTRLDFTQVEDIYLAEYDQYAYDINVAKDYSYVTVRFGNGVAGAKVPKDSWATVNYLETLGSLGNVTNNFVISTILNTTLPLQFYATNFSSQLGGRDEDTLTDIREKAPQKYLSQGGIITIDDYKAAVLSIPSVSKAVAYPGISVDPTTGASRDTIWYSAVDTSGASPDVTTITDYMSIITSGKIHPLDYIKYAPPAFLHLKLNIRAVAKSSQSDLSALQSTLKTQLYSNYGILSKNSDFSLGIDNSSIITYVSENSEVKNVTSRIEAVTDLLPSTFLKDPVLPDYYYTTFTFDRSFLKLRSFNDGVLHCLKVQFYLNCPSCIINSRTLFVIYDPGVSGYKVVQYPYISGITDYTSMSGKILKPGVYPEEIVSTDPDYIPIKLTVDLNSLNPTDLNILGSGTLQVPVYKGTDYFINFPGANPTELDSKITIQVIGEPFDLNITSYYENNIIRIRPEDSTNPAIGDISVEVSNE